MSLEHGNYPDTLIHRELCYIWTHLKNHPRVVLPLFIPPSMKEDWHEWVSLHILTSYSQTFSPSASNRFLLKSQVTNLLNIKPYDQFSVPTLLDLSAILDTLKDTLPWNSSLLGFQIFPSGLLPPDFIWKCTLIFLNPN